MTPCVDLCSSLQSDACWDEYLGTLPKAMNSTTIVVWLLLQRVHNLCAANGPFASDPQSQMFTACGNEALLEPLTPESHADALCDRRCNWTNGYLPPGVGAAVLSDTSAWHVSSSSAATPKYKGEGRMK